MEDREDATKHAYLAKEVSAFLYVWDIHIVMLNANILRD